MCVCVDCGRGRHERHGHHPGDRLYPGHQHHPGVRLLKNKQFPRIFFFFRFFISSAKINSSWSKKKKKIYANQWLKFFFFFFFCNQSSLNTSDLAIIKTNFPCPPRNVVLFLLLACRVGREKTRAFFPSGSFKPVYPIRLELDYKGGSDFLGHFLRVGYLKCLQPC